MQDALYNLNDTLQQLLFQNKNLLTQNNRLLRDIINNTDENKKKIFNNRSKRRTIYEKGQKISMVIEINFHTHKDVTENYMNFKTKLSAANNFNENIIDTYDVYLDSFTTMGAIPSSLVDRRVVDAIDHYKGFIVEFTDFLGTPISSTVTNKNSGMDNDDGGKIHIPNEQVSTCHCERVSNSGGLNMIDGLEGSITTEGTYNEDTYTDLETTTNVGGGGSGAKLEIIVEGDTVTSVIVLEEGGGYEVGDTITVAHADIGGTNATDLVITLEEGDINLNTITLTSANSSLRPGMIVAGMGKHTSDHGDDNKIKNTSDTGDTDIEYGTVWIKSIDGTTITLNKNIKVGINAEIGFYDVDQSKIHRGKKLNFLFRMPEVNFNNVDNLEIEGSITSLSGNPAFKHDQSSGFVMDLILIPVEFKSSNN